MPPLQEEGLVDVKISGHLMAIGSTEASKWHIAWEVNNLADVPDGQGEIIKLGQFYDPPSAQMYSLQSRLTPLILHV
jgi:hypothetical protein